MDKPPKEQLYQDYHVNRMSYSDMAEKYDVSDNKIGKWMKGYDINPGKGGRVILPVGAEELERMYYDEGMSQTEIGEKFNVSQGAISDRMEKHGIEPGKRIDLMAEAVRVPWATHRIGNYGYELWKVRCGEEMKTLPVHRLAMVAWEGFDAVDGKRVHHKNGVKWDNRPENLELLTDSEHKSLHANEWDRDEQGRFDFS